MSLATSNIARVYRLFRRTKARRINLVILVASVVGVVWFLAACSGDVPAAGSLSTAAADSSTSGTSTSTQTRGTPPSETATTTVGGGEANLQTGEVGRNLSPISDVSPALLTGNFAICADCHSLLDRSAAAGEVLVAAFSHSRHVSRGAKCADCHRVPTHSEQEVRKPLMEKCFGCHSQTDSTKPPGVCSACHPAGFSLTPKSHDDPDWLPPRERLDSAKAKHSVQAEAGTQACAMCHATSFCGDCHKLDMPHPAQWVKMHPFQADRLGEATCDRCHPEKRSCDKCHHKDYTAGLGGDKPWRHAHPDALRTQPVTGCLRCHSTITCAHCHTTGQYQPAPRRSASAREPMNQ